uniref:Uncharacterized protein n=1 Tax=Plesiomonas shigelloides TaxID=703 RepID=A0A4D6U7I8_PLESH|nr:hypothetical protein [Plesiomonas shigelloides]
MEIIIIGEYNLGNLVPEKKFNTKVTNAKIKNILFAIDTGNKIEEIEKK